MDCDFTKFIHGEGGLEQYLVAEPGVVYFDVVTGALFVDDAAGSFVEWQPSVVETITDPITGQVIEELFEPVNFINWPAGAGLPHKDSMLEVIVMGIDSWQ